MKKALKIMGMLALLVILVIVALFGFSLYQSLQIANRIMAGADTYTCRQFSYDMQHEEADKAIPTVLAVITYGTGLKEEALEHYEQEVLTNGIGGAVRKVNELCKNSPDKRLLSLYVADVLGTAATGATPVSATVVPQTSAPVVPASEVKPEDVK